MKRILILSLFFFLFFAGAPQKIKIKGEVVSYNKSVVTLSQNKGVYIEAPLNAVPAHLQLRTGQNVYAEIHSSQLKQVKTYKAPARSK